MYTTGRFTIGFNSPKARQEKEKRIAGLGSPIELKGQALDMLVRGNTLWVAENTGSVLVIDLTVCSLTFSPTRCKLTTANPD